MPEDKYAVVEFVDEKTVEVVAKSWVETCDGVGFDMCYVMIFCYLSIILIIKLNSFQELYCYWPRTNVASRIKKLELPDKESWKKYKVRIFSYTGTAH